MTDWIKYDGTNKPDDDALVRVRFPGGWVSAQDDWEPAKEWVWETDNSGHPSEISHFMLKEETK